MSWRCLGISAALAACAASPPGGGGAQTGLDGLALSDIQPRTLLPGTEVVARGASFVDPRYGATRLRLRGAVAGQAVDATFPARFVEFGELTVTLDPAALARFPTRGEFQGSATVEVDSSVDGARHQSPELAIRLDIVDGLDPQIQNPGGPSLIYLNDPLPLEVSALLLPGEGQTIARVDGCFQAGSECVPIFPADILVSASTPLDRDHAAVLFGPDIAGIRPGRFRGTLRLRNLHTGGGLRESDAVPFEVELLESVVNRVGPASVSLGQYLDVEGGGFTEDTVLHLVGELRPDAGDPAPIDLVLVPAFVAGKRVRYLVNEDDALGQRLDLRGGAGVIEGTLAPIVSAASDELEGAPTPVRIGLAPVRQIVYLRFLPSYVESLEHFGLRALDDRIRARIFEVARRDYAGVGIEFRDAPPEDFALYSQVDIVGPDPNGKGLFGFDNTPGKDSGNQRLHDRIGGVNAETQEDGHDGYGGVFIESIFAFSTNPNGLAEPISGADAAFDTVFGPFRPDLGGAPVAASDFAGGGIPTLTSGEACLGPAARSLRAACAVWVLGSLIGTTMTHEVGHSLGLANPESPDDPHDRGDAPDRIMDGGGARPFRERAELDGQGPSRFCDSEYRYLRTVLPSAEPADDAPRPSCN